MNITKIDRKTNLPNLEYHAGPEISSSGLKIIAKQSLAHYKHSKENPKQPTDEMAFGTAYHSYLLTNNQFNNEYFVFDASKRPEQDKDFRSKANKDWKASMFEQNDGKMLLSLEDYETIIAMADVISNDASIRFMLSEGIAEESFYAQIEGIDVRVRPDFLSKYGIIDIKTTRDASPAGFGKIVANEFYHLSAAMYSDVVSAFVGNPLPFFILAQEKTAPYVAQVYLVQDWLLEQGRYEYLQALEGIRVATETGIWTAYQGEEDRDGVRDVEFPRWAVKEVLR